MKFIACRTLAGAEGGVRPAGIVDGMRLCFAISSFGQGGAQKQCVALMNALALDPDIEVQLIYFQEGENFAALRQDRIRAVRLSGGSVYDPRNIFRMARRLRELQPDVVCSWLHGSDVLAALSTLLLGATGRHVPWVMTERDSHYPSNWRYRLRRRLARRARRILCNSEAGRRYWRANGIEAAALHVVPNINLAAGLTANSAGTSEREVVFAGRLEPQKNVRRLAQAFAIAAQGSPARFRILGDGSEREAVSEIVEQAGGAGRVDLEAHQPDILPIYQRDPVYVTLSRHEGTPNALIENISLGNLIVASRIVGHVALLGPEYPFYVAPDAAPSEVARVIGEALAVEHRSPMAFAQAKVAAFTAVAVADCYKRHFMEVAG